MDWPRVKTLLIVMLLLVNGILGGLLLAREGQARALARDAEQALCALLAEKNILASPEQISGERAYSYHWERSPAGEAAAAAIFLGDVEARRAGDTVTRYENLKGQAEFRMNGELSVYIADMPPAPLDFLRQSGIDSPRGNATEGYVQLLEGLPIFRNVVRLIPGEDMRVEGRWYWGEALPVNGEYCHTAGYCLLQLAESLDSTAALRLEACELGFRESQIEPEIILLTPYWRIVLSSQEYFVNAVTAELLKV